MMWCCLIVSLLLLGCAGGTTTASGRSWMVALGNSAYSECTPDPTPTPAGSNTQVVPANPPPIVPVAKGGCRVVQGGAEAGGTLGTILGIVAGVVIGVLH